MALANVSRANMSIQLDYSTKLLRKLIEFDDDNNNNTKII